MGRWVGVLVAVSVGLNGPATAQSGPISPADVLPPPSAPALGEPPPEPSSGSGPGRQPPPVLGAPVLGAPVSPAAAEPSPTRPSETGLAPARTGRPVVRPAGGPDEPTEPPVRRAVLGPPETAGRPIPTQALTVRPAVGSRSSDRDPLDELLARRPTGHHDPANTSLPSTPVRDRTTGFGERLGDALAELVGRRQDWFRSDHIFDGFISPVTNPFLFEDPRSLTELRPQFVYQKIPGRNREFRGGDVWFFGGQLRLAFTDRLSFVVHKLGGLSLSPGRFSAFPDEVGFAELWLGPKYTFLREEETGSVLAGGLQFQLPVGSANVFQNTGSLSLVPYLSYAQAFGSEWRVGGVNTLLGTGYAFSTGNQRSDYYYLSAHIDWDVLHGHKFYPLLELNWLVHTTNGRTRPFDSEGRDLFNFGGQARGTGLLTVAFGARYKILEAAQLGGAFELPVAGARHLFDYRFTFDVIFRY